LGEKGVAYSA